MADVSSSLLKTFQEEELADGILLAHLEINLVSSLRILE